MPAVRACQHCGIVAAPASGGVGEVAEDGEVDVRIEVAERLHLEVLDQLVHTGHAGQQGRDDDHRPRLLGDAGGEIEARQPPRRPSSVSDHALDAADGQLARRNDGQS